MKMTAWKTLFVSVPMLLIGIVFANIYEIGLCKMSFCYDVVEDGIGVPIGLLSTSLFIVSFILLFLREEVFKSWWRFARIYLLVALAFVLLAALSPGGGSFGVSNSFDGEQAAWFTSGLFLVISLILISVKSWRLRKN